ncbi:MAG: DUF167 domain-containing protein [Alphaproteobacteria bacterium]|jgi:uncharacterized protein (TIGR00251 family)
MTADCFQKAPGGVRIRIRLTPKARREGIEGIYDGADVPALKVAIAAPPVDGKANKALIAFLAKTWRLPKTSFQIVAGTSDRNKTLFIAGDPDVLSGRIETELTSCLKSSTEA